VFFNTRAVPAPRELDGKVQLGMVVVVRGLSSLLMADLGPVHFNS
jgi:hypothetical protein